MAAVGSAEFLGRLLVKRVTYRRRSRSKWGRIVSLIVVLAFLFLFILFWFVCGIITARRRRRQGLRPYYSTAWLVSNFDPHKNTEQWHGPSHPDYPAPPYTPSNAEYFAPPPPGQHEMHGTQHYNMYSPPPPMHSGGGYTGGQENGQYYPPPPPPPPLPPRSPPLAHVAGKM